MAFVSVTRLRIRSLRFLPAFLVVTARTRAQVREAEGFLDGALLPDRRWTFWTATLWRDQAAMRSYMVSGAHLAAMPKLLDWCDEASVVHWDGAGALPDWPEADRRMRASGRASKVRRPSPLHAELGYAAPRVTRSVRIAPKHSPAVSGDQGG
jgi:hypothetical protein